ncbi:ribonuclease HI family protein [Patescibacteria group bacterium AH-259-L07]|nr:ribonuclease HI family protein [Patescibacteria group bacterium AH-259-L07]
MKLILYTDGGARGNPGPSGAGAVVYDKNHKVIKKYAQFLGEGTNNQAEYKALILGLEKAKKLGADELDCYLDSKLVVEQLNQKYKIKNPALGSLFIKAWNLSQNFKTVNFYHIPRSQNMQADALVNEAIDNH